MTTNQDRAAQLLYNEGCGSGDTAHYIARRLADAGLLTPDPQPRTLADLLAAGHALEEYQWMQADFRDRSTGRTTRIVITRANQNVADVVFPSGVVSCVYSDELTPLPDLPRMVWPDEQSTEEDMSIIPPEIDTSTGHDDDVDMTPQDATDGYYLVRWWGEEHPVPAEKVQGQWWVIGKPSMLPAKDVLIVSRLIPEVKV